MSNSEKVERREETASTDQWKGEVIQSRADRNETRQSDNDPVRSKFTSVDMAERTQFIMIRWT